MNKMNKKGKIIGLALVAIMVVSLFTAAIPSIVAQAQPDLVITNVWTVDGHIHYTIENWGNANAPRSFTGVYSNGRYVTRGIAQPLAAGQSRDEEINYKGGDTVCADYQNRIAESNEDNNCNPPGPGPTPTPTPTPTPIPTPPDLVVEKTVEFVDGEFVVHYEVTNIGGEKAGPSKICKIVNGVCAEIESVPALGPSGSYCDDFKLEPCPPGETLNITVCADCTHVVDESDETNNCEINIVTCPEVDMPDLVVEKTVEFVDGEFVVHYKVTNIGGEEAGSSKICKIVDGVCAEVKTVPALGPNGGSYCDDFKLEPCPPGETLNITVCADCTHVVDESDETNNCEINEVTCPTEVEYMPDLIVSEKWETPTEWPPNDIAPSFVVHYTVQNIGNKEAGSNKIGKYVNGVLCPHCIKTVPALGPGAIHCGQFDPEDCPCDQILNVTVCADIYKAVDESDETNNCMINEVTCPPAVPEIEVIKTVWDRTATAWVNRIDADVGDVVTFSSTIHNSGFCCNLTNIMVWDVLSPSLGYVGVAGATPAPDRIVNYPDGRTELVWYPTGLELEPCDSVTFRIQARVLDCGVDINTLYARAVADCTGEFIRGEDSALVNGVGIPSIDADKTVRDPDNGNWVNWIRVSRGDTVTFRSTINNDGTCCDLTDIQVLDRLPMQFTYLGATLQPWDITVGPFGTGLGWFIPGPLEQDDSIAILINARADINGQWTNTHEAHAWSECRQTIVTDIDTATVRVVDPPGIQVDKTFTRVGRRVTYTITVTNTGDWALNPVTVVDTLPSGMRYLGDDSAADMVTENPSGTTTITWNNVGPLARQGQAGDTVTITLWTRIRGWVPMGTTLTDEVTATGTHPRYGDVSDTDTVDVIR